MTRRHLQMINLTTAKNAVPTQTAAARAGHSALTGMREACGVVAIYRPGKPAAELVHRALFALQHRGQEGAGIVSVQESWHHLKGRGLVPEALPTYRVRELPGERAIGHVRYSTVPADRAENIQPFFARTPLGRVAIAHNGNLKNAAELERELESEGALLSTSMDTELFVHLMARSKAKDFATALRYAADRAVGAYSLTLLHESRIYALRDPFGIRPLVIGRLRHATEQGGWVVASETCALDVIDAEFVREVLPGELVEIGPAGVQSTQLLAPATRASCVFELVYFARPDSTVFGQSVHGARTRMGELLAERDMEADKGVEGPRADLIVPVPDSGFPAALGYARRSGIPLEKAIIRSHYIGRTFILPDQDSRTHNVKLKLSVIAEAVRGKHVLLVDDSIVRGNTSARIVEMVREAGAASVGMRIASPPLAWPCYLGIDTPRREELVINTQGSVAGVAKAIGADHLAYLTIADLRRATGQGAFCFGCMNGEYPT